MEGIYTTSIKAYGLALKLAAPFIPKAKLWVEGRQDWENKIRSKIDPTDRVLWVHCSSLGEFEQGRPVIEALKKDYPSHKIAVSFFSPSGYEIRKDYPGADLVFYLPLDTVGNAKKLIAVLHPELLVLVKYEYWYNLITALHQAHIPTIVVSAIFREKQNFFQKQGENWFAKKLGLLNHFFVQNKRSEELLNQIGINQVTIAGDTRFDRVKQLIHQDNQLQFMDHFKNECSLIVVGSSWPKDEELFISLINEQPAEWKFLFAPHTIDSNTIQRFLERLNVPAIQYSKLGNATETTLKEAPVFILDTIGVLSKVYAYADITYIGGGFGAGIHNTLEAATYGVPVIFGPKYQKFQEACDLIENNAGFSIANANQFNTIFHQLMTDEKYRKKVGENARHFVQDSPASTKIILDYIEKLLKS